MVHLHNEAAWKNEVICFFLDFVIPFLVRSHWKHSLFNKENGPLTPGIPQFPGIGVNIYSFGFTFILLYAFIYKLYISVCLDKHLFFPNISTVKNTLGQKLHSITYELNKRIIFVFILIIDVSILMLI